MSFLTSLGIILLSGLLLGSVCAKIRLPPLLGMLVVGIVLGPYVLDLISPQILNISADLRQLALIIILTRAGLSFDFGELKKNGRSAILLCFVPACVEIAAYIALGTLLLGLNWIEAAVLGCVMAAVSPAVVVPRMLKLEREGYGTDKGIPQMITAGASADDVFVILLITAFLGMAGSGSFDFNVLWKTPVSILTGVALGAAFGWLFAKFFQKIHARDTVKIIVLLSYSFLFVALESAAGAYVPYSGLLSVIAMGAALFRAHPVCADRLSARYSKLWVIAEILLFVLVGATVDIGFAVKAGGMIAAVIAAALLFRMLGVFICVLKTGLNKKERLFCMIAYTPKATVQAAIGTIPLAAGLACGRIVLTAAVLAILLTAPLGAFLTDLTYKKLLIKS